MACHPAGQNPISSISSNQTGIPNATNSSSVNTSQTGIPAVSPFAGSPNQSPQYATNFYPDWILPDYTPSPPALDPDKKTIVVTYGLFGSLIKALVKDQANVIYLVLNREDIRSYRPSAQDIETLNKADLVMENGLGLETGLLPALNEARNKGVRFFTASDYVDYHRQGWKEYKPYIPIDQSQEVVFPYIWMDYFAMANNLFAFYDKQADFALNLDMTKIKIGNAVSELYFWDHAVQAVLLNVIPPENRVIITDQEPLQFCHYFSSDYKVIVLDLPGLRDSSRISAANLNTLKKAVVDNQAKAVFLKPGIPPDVEAAITRETGVKLVEFNTCAITYQKYQGDIVERGYNNISDIYLVALPIGLGRTASTGP